MPIRAGLHLAALLLLARPLAAADVADAGVRLTSALRPVVSCLNGSQTRYALTIDMALGEGKGRQEATVEIERFGDQAFRLALKHRQFPLELWRTADRTVLLLRSRGTAIVGQGKAEGSDTLTPTGMLARLVSNGSKLFTFTTLASNSTPEAAGASLRLLLGLRPGQLCLKLGPEIGQILGHGCGRGGGASGRLPTDSHACPGSQPAGSGAPLCWRCLVVLLWPL